MRKLDENYIWIVAGDGDDRNRLMKKTEEYGLSGRVHFVGRVDIKNLIDYYNLCDVFIMPKHRRRIWNSLFRGHGLRKTCHRGQI